MQPSGTRHWAEQAPSASLQSTGLGQCGCPPPANPARLCLCNSGRNMEGRLPVTLKQRDFTDKIPRQRGHCRARYGLRSLCRVQAGTDPHCKALTPLKVLSTQCSPQPLERAARRAARSARDLQWPPCSPTSDNTYRNRRMPRATDRTGIREQEEEPQAPGTSSRLR